ncbi:MAG: outer membrane lipoprotein chaperone LolA [Betaproteobacteria bacterium]|nr:outer membrane lipoprotein chaperone LolA [Betaproteobacteria bacterium]
MQALWVWTLLGVLGLASVAARADTLAALQSFVRDARTGSAEFTQTVISPDGAKRRSSSGTFEFSRPNRFRFTYTKPFEQVIVADGQRLWVYDPDLNQVISRKQSSALAATPAALLAGAQLERDFNLSAEPARDGLEWVKAVPKLADGAFESLRIGFRNGELAEMVIVDSLGQRSLLQFRDLKLNRPLPADRLVFAVPKGADVIQQ